MTEYIRIPFHKEPPKESRMDKTIQAMVLAFFFLVGVLILLAMGLGVAALGQAVFH